MSLPGDFTPSLYLVPYGSARRKDIECKFGSSVNEIFVGEMRDKQAYLEILYQAYIWYRVLMDWPTGRISNVDPVSGSIYLEEAKRDNDEIVQIDS